MALMYSHINLFTSFHHFGIEITNPVHFVIDVLGIFFLNILSETLNNGAVDAFTLMRWNNSKKNTKCLGCCTTPVMPEERQLAQ